MIGHTSKRAKHKINMGGEGLKIEDRSQLIVDHRRGKDGLWNEEPSLKEDVFRARCGREKVKRGSRAGQENDRVGRWRENGG